jgi:hypothetical protein
MSTEKEPLDGFLTNGWDAVAQEPENMSGEASEATTGRGHVETFLERGAEKESKPSPIDQHVGSRIRLRRTLMGMSQEG